MSTSYQVFARKYRPLSFKDILGQDHVVRTLANAIEQNRLAHAYLFVGPRGTGKTSTARILAKALNCEGGPKVDFDPNEEICKEIAEGRCLDVLEIDGASNNGVEQVRELRDNVKFAPSSGKYKIYYIDEVHMLSNAAFNALLKTLEEPPEHVKFIFATTEATKILPTIISRCQRFDLRRIPTKVIAEQLSHIASEEGINLDPVAATAIAKGADGGMRDAQSMLDQLVAFCGETIAESDVLEVFGFTGIETITGLGSSIIQKDTVKALSTIYEQSEAGKELSQLLTDLISHFRSVLVFQVDPSGASKELTQEIISRVESQSQIIQTGKLIELIDHFATVEGRMKWSPNKRLHLEVAVIKAVQILDQTSIDDVIDTIDDILSGAPAPEKTPQIKKSLPVKTEETVSTKIKQPSQESPQIVDIQVKQSTKAQAIPEKTPESKPEPQDITTDSEPSGDDTWSAVIEHISKVKPLAADSAARGIFYEDDGKQFIVAMSPEESIAEGMITSERIKPVIEKCLTSMLGARKFKVILKEGISVPEPPPHLAEFEEETEKPVEEKSNTSPPQDLEENKVEKEEQSDDIYNDPLIKEALEVFEAVIREDS